MSKINRFASGVMTYSVGAAVALALFAFVAYGLSGNLHALGKLEIDATELLGGLFCAALLAIAALVRKLKNLQREIDLFAKVIDRRVESEVFERARSRS